MAGGNIKNIARAAAFYAAEDGGTIRMAHLLKASRREYQKLGRTWDEVELEFTLTIVSSSAGTETFANLSMDPRHSRYFANVVASAAVDVELADPPTPTLPAKNLPAVIAATNLAGGVNDNIAAIQTTDYHKGIDTLQKIDDVNILCVPDAVGLLYNAAATQDIQAYMIAHCEKQVDSLLNCKRDFSLKVQESFLFRSFTRPPLWKSADRGRDRLCNHRKVADA